MFQLKRKAIHLNRKKETHYSGLQQKHGVDKSDKMLFVYTEEGKPLKYQRVVFNVFGRMVLNAYVIYSINCKTTKKNYQA